MFLKGRPDDKERRTKYLIKRYIQEHQLNPDTDVMATDLIEWMETDLRHTYCAATYSKYKACVIHTYDDRNLSKLFTNPAPKKSTLPPKTSRQRTKRLTDQDLEKLVDYAENVSKSKWSIITSNWLTSSLHTGLRPHEWVCATLSDDKRFLKVTNEKLMATIENYEGVQVRYVPVEYLADDVKESIDQMLVTAADLGKEGYPYLYRMCAHWLTMANRKLFPRRLYNVALMTPRHQYQANLKQSNLTPKEIAYIVGHQCDDRSFESYAPKRYGNPLNINGDHIPEYELAKITEKIQAKSDARLARKDAAKKMVDSQSIETKAN